jgi:hypothetical protein
MDGPLNPLLGTLESFMGGVVLHELRMMNGNDELMLCVELGVWGALCVFAMRTAGGLWGAWASLLVWLVWYRVALMIVTKLHSRLSMRLYGCCACACLLAKMVDDTLRQYMHWQ